MGMPRPSVAWKDLRGGGGPAGWQAGVWLGFLWGEQSPWRLQEAFYGAESDFGEAAEFPRDNMRDGVAQPPQDGSGSKVPLPGPLDAGREANKY